MISTPNKIIYLEGERIKSWSFSGVPQEISFLPAGAQNPLLSTNGKFVAFWKPGEQTNTRELWVQESETGSQRIIATLSESETRQRYPEATTIQFSFSWIGNTDRLSYGTYPTFAAIGDVPHEATYVADAKTAETWLLYGPGEVDLSRFSPDGSLVATLAGQSLALIDVSTGERLYQLSLNLAGGVDQGLSFSPDGRYLIVFTLDDVTVLDTVSLSAQSIPLKYERIGRSHYILIPSIYWLNKTTFRSILPRTTAENSDAHATYDICDVDIVEAAADRVHQIALADPFFMPVLSPTFQFVIHSTRENELSELRLTDILTGESRLIDSGREIAFLGWHPDGQRFFYRLENQYRLASLCADSNELNTEAELQRITWLDTDRFLAVTYQQNNWQLYIQTTSGDSQKLGDFDDYPQYVLTLDK